MMSCGRGEAAVYDFKRNDVPGSTDRDRDYWRDVGTIDSFFDVYSGKIPAAKYAGKIVLIGMSGSNGDYGSFAAARYNTDGTLDQSFNPTPNGPVNIITIQNDGRILIGGTFIMNFFGISIPGLRIAGGIMMSGIGLSMLTPHKPETREDAEEREAARRKVDISFSPLAMPMLSGPGSIAVTVGLTSLAKGWTDYIAIILGIVCSSTLLGFYQEYRASAAVEDLIKALAREVQRGVCAAATTALRPREVPHAERVCDARAGGTVSGCISTKSLPSHSQVSFMYRNLPPSQSEVPPKKRLQ